MRRILVATDGSRSSANAVAAAVELAAAEGAELTVVHVAERADADEPDAALAAAGELAARHGVRVSLEAAEGPAADSILSLAEVLDPELVVLGSHGRGALVSASLGSVSKSVLDRSTRPLLIVRGPRGAGRRP